MGNRAWNWIGNAFTGLNAGFAPVCRIQSFLRTVRSESCRFGHTQAQDRSNDLNGKPQNSFQRCNSTRVSGIGPGFFWTAQACFYLRLRSKNYRFGHTPRLKADPMVQEVSPRTVPVRHQRYNKKPAKPAFNQRPCRHSIH